MLPWPLQRSEQDCRSLLKQMVGSASSESSSAGLSVMKAAHIPSRIITILIVKIQELEFSYPRNRFTNSNDLLLPAGWILSDPLTKSASWLPVPAVPAGLRRLELLLNFCRSFLALEFSEMTLNSLNFQNIHNFFGFSCRRNNFLQVYYLWSADP